MSDERRNPGRVDEAALPVGEPLPIDERPVDGGQPRRPGPVDQPAVPVTEPVEAPPAGAVNVAEPVIESGPWLLVGVLAAGLITAGLLVSSVRSLIALSVTTPWLGIPLSALAAALLVALVFAGLREYRALRAVDGLALRNETIRQALRDDDLPAVRAAVAPVLAGIARYHPSLLERFESTLGSEDSAGDFIRQFELLVLEPLDREAERLIRRAVAVGGAGVAVLPHPALDALFVLWRGRRLVRQIGLLYGLEPTGLTSWRLLKHVITSAFIAASVEEVGTLAVEQAVQEILAQAVKSVAEGAVTAGRLYRLGRLAQRSCRPPCST